MESGKFLLGARQALRIVEAHFVTRIYQALEANPFFLEVRQVSGTSVAIERCLSDMQSFSC